MHCRLERSLAEQCAAVLLGRKPAALFSLALSSAELAAVVAMLRENGIYSVILPCTGPRQGILAYHPQLLQATIENPIVQRLLRKMGYPSDCSMECALSNLRLRMYRFKQYPHEIGLFLGYPPADVVGFIVYGGQHFKHRCMWKVYGNVERAKALQQEYDLCRRLSCAHIEQGGSLRSLHTIINKAG